MIKRRSFFAVLIFSFITCGLYFLYYIYALTRDLNEMAGDDGYHTDPTLAAFLTLITCGLYDLYWLYRQGNRMKRLADCNGIYCDETGTVYLLWAVIGSLLCGLGGLIAQYMMIRNFNNLADSYNARVLF